jgi:hypothetical protein
MGLVENVGEVQFHCRVRGISGVVVLRSEVKDKCQDETARSDMMDATSTLERDETRFSHVHGYRWPVRCTQLQESRLKSPDSTSPRLTTLKARQ